MSVLYIPSVIDPNDGLIYVLFGENVFTVDSILAKVDSGLKVQMFTYLSNPGSRY